MSKAQEYKEYWRAVRIRRNLFFKLKDYSIYPLADLRYNHRPKDIILEYIAENHLIARDTKVALNTACQSVVWRHGQMLEWGTPKRYYDYIYKPQFLRALREIYHG
jgi:hypothetical protein